MMRTNKYNAKKVQIHGIWFDSRMEAMHYLVLRDRERKGEISNLTCQPSCDLVVNGKIIGAYTADFAYTENGVNVWEDVKGFKARDFALRSKLFQALNIDIELRVNGKPIKQRSANAPKRKKRLQHGRKAA